MLWAVSWTVSTTWDGTFTELGENTSKNIFRLYQIRLYTYLQSQNLGYRAETVESPQVQCSRPVWPAKVTWYDFLSQNNRKTEKENKKKNGVNWENGARNNVLRPWIMTGLSSGSTAALTATLSLGLFFVLCPAQVLHYTFVITKACF